MHSALGHMVQQLSVSSLFCGHGAQLRLADSLTISALCHPHYAESQGTHSDYRDGGVSTLVSLFFPIVQNSLYLVPPGVFPHEQELLHSVTWKRLRSGLAMAQHSDGPHLSRLGVP